MAHSVLIVDDESQIRDLLVRWIADEDHETRQASSAEAALDEMAVRPADVVLCDMQMPGQGGLWLVGQLRTRFPHVAVVLATADTSVPPVTSMQPGVIEYLIKPFKHEAVLTAIRHAVAWNQTARTTTPRPPTEPNLDEL